MSNNSKIDQANTISSTDLLSGSKLIERASKYLSKKFPTISRDTWKKEALELLNHNDNFDGEPVSLSWFTNRLESIASDKYAKPVPAEDVRSENDSSFKDYQMLKRRGDL